MTRRGLLVALAAVAFAVGCEKLDGATDPVWGKEPCGHCAMLVGDRRFAAEVVTDSERRFFDDIGCMVLWAEAHPGKVVKAWVRDAQGTAWLDASAARYARATRTPMDFGFEGRAPGAPETVGFEEMKVSVLQRSAR